MELYRKKQLIELVETLPNGDAKVQNKGEPSDQWAIPKEVFESTYEKSDESLDFKERIIKECKELKNKYNALHKFKQTEKFHALDRISKDLLYKQFRLMDEYIEILCKRLDVLGVSCCE